MDWMILVVCLRTTGLDCILLYFRDYPEYIFIGEL